MQLQFPICTYCAESEWRRQILHLVTTIGNSTAEVKLSFLCEVTEDIS